MVSVPPQPSLQTVTDPATARRMHRIVAAHLAAQVRGLPASAEGEVLEFGGGGVAAFARGEFGRKLNHVIGFGLAPPDGALLDDLERRYALRGLPVELDLCPHVAPATFELLSSRGYSATDVSNTYIRLDEPVRPAGFGVRVLRATPRQAEDLVTACVAGFSVQARPRPRELLEVLPLSALARNDTVCFLAEVDGRIAGSAAVSLIADGEGTVAHLFMASTLPEFRGRGVQPALFAARLSEARDRGARVAQTCTRLANVSARNAERAGFRLCFTETTFVGPAP